MTKRYKFSNINESKYSNDDIIDRAINAAVDKGLGEPDYTRKLRANKFSIVVLIYGDEYKGDKYIYSCNSGKIINDEPLCEIRKCDNSADYFIVRKYIDPNKKLWSYIESNFVDEDGFTLDEWYDDISVKSDLNGYHIAYDDDGYYLINVNGDKRFKDPKPSLDWCGDYILCYNDDREEKTLYDRNGKIVADDISNINEFSDCYYNEDGVMIDYYFYEISYYEKTCLYDSSMNIMADDIGSVFHRDDFYIVSYRGSYNIIGKGNKLLFGDDPYDKSEWVDNIKTFDSDILIDICIIERNKKYNLFDGKHLSIIFDTWFDQIKYINIEYIGIEHAIAVKNGGKYNIYVIDITRDNLDEFAFNDEFCHFLFNEPVDGIAEYNNLLMARKDNVEYVVWKNTRLLMVKCYNIWKVGDDDTYTYTIKVGDKFDFINTNDDKTFCEKYMNGNKFDNCFDFTEMYPMVEYKGKYGYVDADYFRPLFGDDNNDKMTWFDDAEPCIYDDEEDIYIFQVVINGEKVKINQYGNYVDDQDDDYQNN